MKTQKLNRNQSQEKGIEDKYEGDALNDIEEVVSQLGCVRCGGCFAICPPGAIKMIYNDHSGYYDIQLARDECVNCGKCVEICPALFEYTNTSENPYIGDYRSMVMAASVDMNVRRNSSSGGIVNSILSYLLRKKICDVAILVRALHKEPFAEVVSLSEPDFIENNPREISSRYVLIPTVSKMKEIDKRTKLCFVGTPCQAYAARRIAEARDLDVVIVSVACFSGTSSNATKQLLKFYGIEEVKKIYYRGNGWPGEVYVEGRDRKKNVIEVRSVFPSSLFDTIYWSRIFLNPACWDCKDHFGEFSDISAFDYWNPEEINREEIGRTGVIVRTRRGERIINQMAQENCIEIYDQLDANDVIRCQPGPLRLKKERNRPLKAENVYARSLETFIHFQKKMISREPNKPRLMIVTLSRIFSTLLRRARYRGGIL